MVNPQFPLIKLPDLMNMDSAMDGKPDIQMDEHAATLLKELLASIHCKDEITAVSGFRTQEEQENIWKNSLSKNGLDFTKKFVAIPGCSEHQTGLAIDLAYILLLKEKTDLEHPYIYRTTQTNIEISYIPLDDEKTVSIQIPDIFPYMISGTNEGGAILSLWREDHA